MSYQVGNLINYDEDDSVFSNLEDAEVYAIEKSYNDSPIGVWTDQRGETELITIVYQQQVFRP